MNTVEPIRDKAIVKDIFDFLKLKNSRDALMSAMGVYTGLRISDILNLRIRDIRNKEHISLREKKTRKEKLIPINKFLRGQIDEYIFDKKDFEYIFKSPNYMNKPITRQQAYNILIDAAKKFGVESVGCHTLRKTFGYLTYQKTKDAAMLRDIFNHSDIHTTLRYIGVNQDTKNKIYNEVDILE
ncbi:MAG: tyrosine-type recombinase/integrase [Anaerocolumna sp.]